MENIDFKQINLFGKKVISSIGYDEQEIIRDILFLHCKGKYIDCDPTYSIGNFYKYGLPKPKFRFDKFPKTKDVEYAESHKLPINNNTCNVLMFDPPFIFGVGKNAMTDRFSQFTSFDELKTMYKNSISEFYRVIKDKGILIFKCQDVATSGINYFTHCFVKEVAEKNGFRMIDMFILLSRNRVNYPNKKQFHARKYHSYFMVFKKIKPNVNYEF